MVTLVRQNATPMGFAGYVVKDSCELEIQQDLLTDLVLYKFSQSMISQSQFYTIQ